MDHGARAVAFQLEVILGSALATGVLRRADFGRFGPQHLRYGAGVEDDLNHLPVTLVSVIPIVEVVEEPVLDHETVAPSLHTDTS